MPKSTRKQTWRKATGKERPPKPYKDFPLYAHPLGYWSKKILGTIHHFGRWGRVQNGQLVRVEGDGWKEALETYQHRKDDLYAGRTPRTPTDRLSVVDLCERFLTAKFRKLEAREISRRMWLEYKGTSDLLITEFGKARLVEDLAAGDFEKLRAKMAERWGPVRLGNEIGRIKSVFKFGIENGLIEKAIRYGTEFKKPGKAVLRRHKAQSGPKMLEAGEVRKLIDAADVQMRAMILLGVNCGFGNHDVAALPLSALDLGSRFIDYARPKTGIPRRCPLWAETVAALHEVMSQRPNPKHEDAANLVFVNSRGSQWTRTTEKSRIDNVSIQFKLLMKRCSTHREGIGFYTLRHVFRTIADAARDPVAIDLIMGHTDSTMASHYRERVDDSRLQAVAEHVRQWLFGEPPDGKDTEPESNEPTTLHAEDMAADEAEADEVHERPMLRLFAG
jgi:integrase